MGNLEKLYQMRDLYEQGGGADRIETQHNKGKLTARERLGLLFDEGTFEETGMFRRHRCTDFGMQGKEAPGDGVVTGFGRVNGRLVYAYAQDFTVQGGTLGEAHAAKICSCMDRALANRAPVVGLMDSGGARIQEGVDALSGFGNIFYRNTRLSGVVPQISAIMGPCAGGAVYSPAITDFIFMVDKTSNMFITGPDVIKTVTGEQISLEELGGGAVHNRVSGVAHFLAADDYDCIRQIRDLLSYLPQNNEEKAPVYKKKASLKGLVPELDGIIPDNPRRAYDMKDVINLLCDSGSFLEVQKDYACNIIIGLGRFEGRSVGIIASQPKVAAGCLDVDSSDKAARFIRFCDAFNIPLLTLVDVPGFLPGKDQERRGIIRHGAKMLFAYSEATVTKITVITRKAYGGAYIGMCCQTLGADAVFAWPTADIAVMGAEGAVKIVYKKEIQSAADKEAFAAQKTREYEEKFTGPYVSAERGYVDDVVAPSETRCRIIKALEAGENKRDVLPGKKHGNIPL